MANPKGMTMQPFKLSSGDAIHLYSDAGRIVLQVRRNTPTESDLLAPSFKVAAELTAAESLALAGALP